MTNVDPAATYRFSGMAINMAGWSCGYTGLPPDVFWFSSTSVTGTPSTADGTRFVTYLPNPASCGGELTTVPACAHEGHAVARP